VNYTVGLKIGCRATVLSALGSWYIFFYSFVKLLRPRRQQNEMTFSIFGSSSSLFEPDVACFLFVIPLQRRSCYVCMSFVRLGHHNG